MNRLLALALCCSLASVTSVAVAQPSKPATPPPAAPAKPAEVKKEGAKKEEAKKEEAKKDDKPAAGGMDEKAMQAAMEKMAEPGPMHKWLAALEGDWQAEVKEMGMDGKWTTSKGEMNYKMVHGGRFLELTFKGRAHGKFFYGGGVMGYNNASKQFESAWYSSMQSGLMLMYGQPDKDGKVLTLKGECDSPMGDAKSPMREVITIVSKDQHRFEMYTMMPGADGKMAEAKIMEINYTKGKAESKDDKAEKKDDKKDKK